MICLLKVNSKIFGGTIAQEDTITNDKYLPRRHLALLFVQTILKGRFNVSELILEERLPMVIFSS